MADSKPNTKGLYIKTYGCQMNVYDSERMKDVLKPLGYAPVDSPEAADLVVLNTCHIREKATEKVFSELGRLREMKQEAGGNLRIAVAGCVAQAEGDEIMRREPAVDMVVGPQSYHRLPEMIAKLSRKTGDILETDFAAEEKFDALPKTREVDGASAFLSIQEGCDKFCTFCVVPYTRGSEYSRSVAAIVGEAERLARQGAIEVTLLGQNVNAFHGEGPDGDIWGLGRLIRRIGEIEGVRRLRYTTSHPGDIDDELIEAHRDVPRLMPFLHLPVQSGSDRILQAMNRRHTAEAYLRLVDRLRGCLAALAEAGLALPEGWMPAPTAKHPQKGYWQMKTILDQPHRPTAVVAISDRTAFGAISAVREAGLAIPQDLALVSIDNVADSVYTYPALTTYHIPKHEMGVLAMQKLHRIIEGKPELAVKSVVYGELIVRESCGAPRGPGNRPELP